QNVAFNGTGTPASLTSSSSFTLNSLFLAGAWNDGLQVTIDGYSGGIGGTRLDTITVSVNTTGASFFDLEWSGIDAIRFSSAGGTPNPVLQGGIGPEFALDNLTINAPVVPGPIAGAGLPGLVLAWGAFLTWRRRRQLIART